jgi:hypothetical protein
LTTERLFDNVVEQMFYAGRQKMAIVRVTPTQVDVSCGFFDGRPRQVRIAHERVPVIEIAQVRDELAAYPVALGPRRIFDVRTPDARLRLSFSKRRRRWLLEGLEAA